MEKRNGFGAGAGAGIAAVLALPSNMIRFRWRQALIAAILSVGFALYWSSIAFEWNTPLWALIVGVVVGIGAISLLSFRPAHRGGTPDGNLYASDAYSDAYLGRSRPTHPDVDAAPTAQVGPPPPADPISRAIRQEQSRDER